MGILYSSGSTIVVDAVLTDLGRKLLARNDGSFQVSMYAFGDDEIDYNLYDRSGATEADREALILSTPIFEASTNEDIALKYRLLTIRDPNLTALPILSTSTSTGTIKETGAASLPITFAQTMPAGMTVPPEILDDVFILEVDNYLLNVYKNGELQTPTSITPLNIAQYVMLRDSDVSPSSGGKLTIAVNVKTLAESIWTTLAAGSGAVGSRTLTTYIRCTGIQSGMMASYTLNITEVA